MYILPDIVREELDFFKTGDFIKINIWEPDSLDIVINKIKEHDRLIISVTHEAFANQPLFDNILLEIGKTNKVIKICTSSPSFFPYSTHPLTNLIMWKDVTGRDSIGWFSENTKSFPDYLSIDTKIKDFSKKVKSILSVRKENTIRNYLFSKITPKNNVIHRYANWPAINTDEDFNKIDNFPKLNELWVEYLSSYISFVVETSYETEIENFSSVITEKTLMAILSGTMPIVLGPKNILNDLEKIGIKTFNLEFGFGKTTDFMSSESTIKIDKFAECVNNVYNLSIDEIKKIWESNIDIIQKNYDIIASILYNDEFNNLYYTEFEISQKLMPISSPYKNI